MTPIVDPREYYAGADVRQRIHEYCGASAGHPPTCAFVSELAPGGHVTWATTALFNRGPAEAVRSRLGHLAFA